ncbi:hypothetical protein GALMADRAFT_255896 [Galerina marginata CBS 339.88]|uniref:F-box domain-containing protein n=1 Tax=Galerina marginata (strain CBS 339.88) TaxID=685588 RepID=A0A067SNZ4_GALM3|nr:hypothetical protein GALMADRAFT_255896 [Galerina marginata CBS 339.88]
MGAHPFRLDYGLLWHVISFIVNSYRHKEWNMAILDMEDPRPLITLRHVSQVCSAWRNLVLSTTSWWARLIDLTILDQASDGWRNEVLRRSGKSPLHIMGVVKTRNAKYLVEVLLKDHSTRIRVLHLICYNHQASQVLYSNLSQCLQHPAPSLEVFVFHLIFTPRNTEILEPLPIPLFSNFAPSLRYFRLAPLRLGAFIEAPFIAQLRKLDFSNRDITIHQLANILNRTHFLEEVRDVRLIMTTDTGGISSFHVPEIILPHLRHISLEASNISAWLAVMSNITPAPQCELHTALVDLPHRSLEATDVLGISRILSFYSERYPSSQSPPAVFLHVGKSKIRLRLSYDSLVDTPDIHSFVLETPGALPTHTASILIRSLRAYDFRSTISLNLGISISNECDLEPTDSNFIEFVSSLASVESLTTDLSTIQFLLYLGELPALALIPAHANILPSMRTLMLPYSTDPTISQVLTAFISWREKIGFPIEVLDVTPKFLDFSSRDFRFLEQFTGLKVKYHETEYVCGSSNPEVLDYRMLS